MKISNNLRIIFAICMFAAMISCQEQTATKSADDRSITTEELKQLMKKNKNFVLLDVRTDEEVAGGMIPGAIQIDFNGADFDEKIKALDKQSTIVAYCRSGTRSGYACDKLNEAGYLKIKNYGGYSRWLEENK